MLSQKIKPPFICMKGGFILKLFIKKRTPCRTAQPITLAAFPPWGIHQELVAQHPNRKSNGFLQKTNKRPAQSFPHKLPLSKN